MIGLDGTSFVLVVAAVVGLIIGSFIGAVVLRLPRGETIVHGRSHCDACGSALGFAELIPILSYMIQQGRCRHCRGPIAVDQLIAEIGGLVVGLIAVLSAPSIDGAVLLAPFGWALLALALLDARHLWLPDVITLPLMLLGLLSTIALPQIPVEDRLLGLAIGFGALEILRRGYRQARGQEGLGAGDAKLLGAIGAWLGIGALPGIVLAAASLGLVVVGIDRWGRFGCFSDRLPLGTFLSIAALAAIPIVLGPVAIVW